MSKRIVVAAKFFLKGGEGTELEEVEPISTSSTISLVKFETCELEDLEVVTSITTAEIYAGVLLNKEFQAWLKDGVVQLLWGDEK